MNFFLFFFNDTATTEIYTLSLHDALPISTTGPQALTATIPVQCFDPVAASLVDPTKANFLPGSGGASSQTRSEEHTSELQSLTNLVCRLLLEKKNNFGGACPRAPLDRRRR